MQNLNFVAWGADSYKVAHPGLYPEGTQGTYVYAEGRVPSKWGELVFFGLQYWLQSYFAGQVVTDRKIAQAKILLEPHFGSKGVFEEWRWQHILQEHNGLLPLSIHAIPEGTVIAPGNVLYTIENTCPSCYWLPGYCDTLLTQLWGPIAIASMGRAMKRILAWFLQKTSDTMAGLDYMLHDFGYRGSIGVEHAAITGAAHLVNFKGTDTLPALSLLQDYYSEFNGGVSVPATEHTVTISHGEQHEVDFVAQVLNRFPSGIVSIVIDTYDTEHFVREIIGTQLADWIRNRQGKVVLRPDSGDPTKVLPMVLDTLGEKFGWSTNAKGYKVLPPYLGVIQGDHVYDDTLWPMLKAITARGWSVENVVFGCGGGLRRIERNDVNFVMKCSEVHIYDVAHKVSKHPVTDMQKKSKEGCFAVVGNYLEGYETIALEKLDEKLGQKNLLTEVFRNGACTTYPSFRSIRARAEVDLL